MVQKIMKASEIAALVNGEIKGNPEQTVTAVSSLKLATAADVSFLSNMKYKNQLAVTKAGIVLVPQDEELTPGENQTFIVCAGPDRAFTKLCAEFAPPPVNFPEGIHPRAYVHPTAIVGEGSSIGPCAVIDEGAVIGKNTVIGAGCYVGHFAKVGDNCLIYPNVSIMRYCELADKIILHSGVVIGGDGFGFAPSFTGLVKIPQTGIVRIESNVEIGANSTVDRARFGKTWIKKGVKIDNLVQVGHNVVVGESSVLIAQVGIAGSSEVGRGVTVSAQCGINGHITLGDGATIAGASAVQKSVPPGTTVIGYPAESQKEFVERHMVPRRVRSLMERVAALEKKLAELENK